RIRPCPPRSRRRCARRRPRRPHRCGPRHRSGPRLVPRKSSKKPLAGALDTGLRLLARRSHSRFELRRKLGRRGYEEAEVDAAVARLVELRYLDDRSFAEGHVRRRSATRGPLALSAELAARGVDREPADRAVVTHFDNRINEVHITCLSTNSSCYWRWRWWPSPAGSDWPTCCSVAGRAMGVLSWSSRPSRPWPRPKPRPRRSCWRPKRKP